MGGRGIDFGGGGWRAIGRDRFEDAMRLPPGASRSPLDAAASPGGRDDPFAERRMHAAVGADGTRSLGVETASAAAPGTFTRAAALSVGPDGSSSLAVEDRSKPAGFSGRSFTSAAATPVTGGVGMTPDGRIGVAHDVEAKAEALGRIAGARDSIVDGLASPRGPRDVEVQIDRQVGEHAVVAAHAKGRDARGFPLDATMEVEHGAARFTMRDGRSKPTWQREVRDKGFDVSRDGLVETSGRAADMTRGFLEDPARAARGIEGRDTIATPSMAALMAGPQVDPRAGGKLATRAPARPGREM